MTNYFKILDFTLKGLLINYMWFYILINNIRSLNLPFDNLKCCFFAFDIKSLFLIVANLDKNYKRFEMHKCYGIFFILRR